MAIRPLDDRVVIRVSQAQERTGGGIVLPDTAKEKSQQGTVEWIGPGRRLEDGSHAAVSVKKGETVLFGKYAGTDVKIDDVEYKILREADILAKLEK